MEGVEPQSVSQHDLEQLAMGLSEDPALLARVESSPELKARLAQIRDDNALLSELAMTQGGQAVREFDEIPGYELLGEIHRGGQGVVHRARQRSADRVVAVKTLLQGSFATEGQRHRFEREVKLAARLQHPGIVTLHESGRTATGLNFIVMEFVEGETIDRWSKRMREEGRTRDIVTLFATMCDAIRYAHQRGVIHRDLKPGNVLVDAKGQPHVLDFGIAKALNDDDDELVGMTRTGEFVGTLAYAAPEQVSGDPDLVDIRIDVYAIGVMLYEALTGERPIKTVGSLSSIVARISTELPLAASKVSDEIDADLNTIVMTALAKSPRERYQSADDLRDDLVRWLGHRAIAARSHDFWYVARKGLWRHRVPAAIAGVFLLVIVGFLAVTSVLAFRLERENRGLEQTVSAIGQALARVDQETSNVQVSDLEEFLEGTNEALGRWLKDRPDIAASLRNSLGLAYLDMEKFADAETQLRQAVELRKTLRPTSEAAIAESQHNLGRVLWRMERFDEAAEVYRSALKIRMELYGPENEDVVRTTHHLAQVLQDLGRPQQAVEMWERTVEARRKLLGPESPDVANSMLGLGTCLQLMGRLLEAKGKLEAALRIVEASYGPDSLPVGRVKFRLGSVLIDLDRLSEAETILNDTRRINALKNSGTLDMARTLHELGRLELTRGTNLTLAETYTRDARSMRERWGNPRRSLAESDLQLGRIAAAHGDLEAAEKMIRGGIALLDQAGVAEVHCERGVALTWLAEVLWQREKYADAEDCARNANVILAEFRDASDEQLVSNEQILAKALAMRRANGR